MGYNLQGYIDDVLQPKIMETVFVRDLQPMLDTFSTDPFRTGGPAIVKDICTSQSSNAANYDRTDVNPVPDTFETAQASWTRTYQHVAFDVSGIDLSQAKNGGLKGIQDAVAYKSQKAWRELRSLIFSNFYTQLGTDISSSAAYSDNSLSRSTYPTLASQENDSDTTMTLPIMRALKFATTLNKSVDPMDYTWILEPTVNKVVMELIGAQKVWTINDPQSGQKIAGGYQEAASFDSNRILSLGGMTVGDAYFVNTNDVYIDTHRPFEIEQVFSGKDSIEFVMRLGMDLWVDNPGHQAKATDKD